MYKEVGHNKCYSVMEIMLHYFFALSHNALKLLEKLSLPIIIDRGLHKTVITFNRYRSGHMGTGIASLSYRFKHLRQELSLLEKRGHYFHLRSSGDGGGVFAYKMSPVTMDINYHLLVIHFLYNLRFWLVLAGSGWFWLVPAGSGWLRLAPACLSVYHVRLSCPG
jgi:hypothetical protein